MVEDRNRITDLVSELRRLRADVDGLHYREPPSIPIPLLPQLPPPLSSKRSLDEPATPPQAKRYRMEAPQYTDVLYGPVNAEGNPRTIANAALGLIPDLSSEDVFSAQYAHNRRGVLSLRFRDQTSADRFISFIANQPLLEGQTAVYAGAAGSNSVSGSGPEAIVRRSSGLTPREIIRGPQPGKSPRRR